MQPMVDPSLLQDFDRLFSTSLIFLKCLIPTCPVRVKRGWLLRVSHVGGRQWMSLLVRAQRELRGWRHTNIGSFGIWGLDLGSCTWIRRWWTQLRTGWNHATIRILLLKKTASGCFRAGRGGIFMHSLFGGLIVKCMIIVVQLRQHGILLASVQLAALCCLWFCLGFLTHKAKVFKFSG